MCCFFGIRTLYTTIKYYTFVEHHHHRHRRVSHHHHIALNVYVSVIGIKYKKKLYSYIFIFHKTENNKKIVVGKSYKSSGAHWVSIIVRFYSSQWKLVKQIKKYQNEIHGESCLRIKTYKKKYLKRIKHFVTN